jgi:hypothetical protein
MFESLDDQMKQDDKALESTKETVLKWVVGAILAVAIFGGLIFAVRQLG